MKRLQPFFSFFIAVVMILSVAVFPAAEQIVMPQREGTPLRTDPAAAQVSVATQQPGAESFSDNGSPAEDTLRADAPQGEPAAARNAPFDGESALQETAAAQPATETPSADAQAGDDHGSTTLDTVLTLTFGKDHSAILGSVNERHIYTLTVSERGFLLYTVSHGEMHDFTGWEATLYREYYLNGVDGEVGFRPLNLLKTTALNTAAASPSVGLMPGNYRIVIRANDSKAEEYRLNAVFTTASDHEIEYNDTKAAYTELYTDIPMIGSASCYADHQDDDWYLLRIRSDGRAQLTFTHETRENLTVAWRVALYDEAGVEIYSENSGLNTASLDSGELGLPAGNYFVAVLCRTRCDFDYTLTVTSVADDRFERENNDSFSSADELPLGGMISGCVTSKAGKLDRDCYRFTMAARGNFALVFTHAPAALEKDKNGWRIRLLSETGAVMYSMISTWNASADRMPVLGLEEGVYYVEISSEDMYRSILTYTLIAGVNESTGFEMEPNNTQETANPVAVGVPITGTIVNAADPDDDYFRFTLSAYSRVTVALRHSPTESERDIFSFSVCDANGEKAPLYAGAEPVKDDSGNNVFYVRSLGSQPEAAGEFALPPGTYYIKVTSGRFFDSVNYTVAYYLN